jgi:hypothetical protein
MPLLGAFPPCTGDVRRSPLTATTASIGSLTKRTRHSRATGKGVDMSVAKNIEITAASPKGFEDAIANGLKRASSTTENIQRAWIKEMYVDTDNGKIHEYRVNMKVTFMLKE